MQPHPEHYGVYKSYSFQSLWVARSQESSILKFETIALATHQDLAEE